MCRHVVYLGAPVTLAEVLIDPPQSLYRQSWAPKLQRHGTVNADGFGVGWYPVGAASAAATARIGDFADVSEAAARPARYRRSVPIWTDANLAELSRVIRTGAVLAAVRSATEGTSQDECAAAPFRDGPWLFSHNGAIRDWRLLPDQVDLGLSAADLLGLESSCDSALLWAAVRTRLRAGEPPQEALVSVVRQVAAARPEARLNLLLTDGRIVVATRHGDTLWYREAPDGLVLASEPYDESEQWREVPEDSLVYGSVSEVSIRRLSTDQAAQQRPSDPAAGERYAPGRRFTLDHRLTPDYFDTRLREDVLEGLAEPPRSLPPKWFYDARGSELFEEITLLPEYYLTRAEQEILDARAPQIALDTAAGTLVEIGAGSSRKTRTLLDALTRAGTLERYAPLDVSTSALVEAGEALCRDYPALHVTATVTDFETELVLPHSDGPRLVAFLGSTIGNFTPVRRRDFFTALRAAMTDQDTFLLGADLVKDADALWRAYNDSSGVTAAFNKNVLHVLNRELDADFDVDAFDHNAVWNAGQDRIEMWLRSRLTQTIKVRALDLTLEFGDGEEMLTEISTKFRREGLVAELARAGFRVREWWTDSAQRFALLLAAPAVR
ncbi:MAG TPA: L-histidine N(alpha)-methyltransferase [Actinocrinis sp.]|nr:L-histidine N(alpha)-methyltransferase [Actinocrinis sp.]HZP52914.1 L-histidine N(alpha)-methyltransferase [Actinocrinis sp.]